MKGGPFQFSPMHNDDGANLQQAVVHVDVATGTYHTTGLFWYLAHFAKFVRPGSVLVKTVVGGAVPPPSVPEGTSGVEAVAFAVPDQGFVAVLMNHDQVPRHVSVHFEGKVAELKLPPVSVITATWGVN